jgi:hypothetical protein
MVAPCADAHGRRRHHGESRNVTALHLLLIGWIAVVPAAIVTVAAFCSRRARIARARGESLGRRARRQSVSQRAIIELRRGSGRSSPAQGAGGLAPEERGLSSDVDREAWGFEGQRRVSPPGRGYPRREADPPTRSP